MDRLYRSKAVDVERIRVMMSDDESDDDSTDNGKEFDGVHVEPRGDSENT